MAFLPLGSPLVTAAPSTDDGSDVVIPSLRVDSLSSEGSAGGDDYHGRSSPPTWHLAILTDKSFRVFAVML